MPLKQEKRQQQAQKELNKTKGEFASNFIYNLANPMVNAFRGSKVGKFAKEANLKNILYPVDVLGETGNKNLDEQQTAAILEAKQEAELKFPDDENARKNFIVSYLKKNFAEDPYMTDFDLTQIPEWATKISSKANNNPIDQDGASLTNPTPSISTPVETPTPSPSPIPEPIIAPSPKPASTSAYAPAYMATTTPTSTPEPAKESPHPWLNGIQASINPQFAKPIQQAYKQPVKQFGSAEAAFKAAPYATEVSKVDGMGYVPKAVPLSVGEEVAENVRRSKADIAAKGLGSESDVEETDIAKPMRITNPYMDKYKTGKIK